MVLKEELNRSGYEDKASLLKQSSPLIEEEEGVRQKLLAKEED